MPDDWIDRYVKLTSEQEAPEIAHRWTAVSLIASAMSRRVWLDRGFYTLYPNQFILMVAESGARKSTAVNFGVSKILRPICAETNCNEIITGAITREAIYPTLLDRMSNTISNHYMMGISEALLYAPEFSTLMSRRNVEQQLTRDLADLYDCEDGPRDVRFKTQPTIMLYNICINILGATTPRWLVDTFPQDAVGEGLMGRFVIVYFDKGTINFDESPGGELLDGLRTDLSRIARLSGEFSYEPKGYDLIKSWYNQLRRAAQPDDERTIAFYNRQHDHVLKLSMALAAAKSSDLVITQANIEKSISWLDEIKSYLPDALVETTFDPRARNIERVMKRIRQHGGEATRTQIMSYMSTYLRTSDLDEIMETLRAAGRIHVVKSSTPPVKYALTKKEKKA